MGITKKTLLLSDANFDHKSMATLTLEKKGKETLGVLKTYYLENKHCPYILGIASNGVQVAKEDIQFFGGNQTQFRVGTSLDLESKITCVMVTSDTKSPVIWGSTDKLDDTRYAVVHELQKDRAQEKENKKSSTMVLSTPVMPMEEVSHVQGAKLFEEADEEELNQLITATIERDEEPNLFRSEMEKLGESAERFYDQIKDQIEDLFASNKHEENLERLIEGSKWVLVDSADGSGEYILGLLYNGQTIEYIAYGVKGEENTLPPAEFRTYSQFIPTDLEKRVGYWVMYQDADSGDNCKLADDVA